LYPFLWLMCYTIAQNPTCLLCDTENTFLPWPLRLWSRSCDDCRHACRRSKSAESAIRPTAIGDWEFYPQYTWLEDWSEHMMYYGQSLWNSNVTPSLIRLRHQARYQTISVGSNAGGDPIVVGTDLYVTNSGARYEYR
jgi:hypothetical protein